MASSLTVSKSLRRTISKDSSTDTVFHNACTRPKYFSNARNAVTPLPLPASTSDSGNEASMMAFGTSLMASVSDWMKLRLLS